MIINAYIESSNASFSTIFDASKFNNQPGTKYSRATKASNWSNLIPVLMKCGVNVDATIKGRILHGDIPVVLDVMEKFRKQLITRFPPKNKYKISKRRSLVEQQKSKVVKVANISGPKSSKKSSTKRPVNRGTATSKNDGITENTITKIDTPKQLGSLKKKKKAKKLNVWLDTNDPTNNTTHESGGSTKNTGNRPAVDPQESVNNNQLDNPNNPDFDILPSRLDYFTLRPDVPLSETSSLFEFLVLSLAKSLSAQPYQVSTCDKYYIVFCFKMIFRYNLRKVRLMYSLLN